MAKISRRALLLFGWAAPIALATQARAANLIVPIFIENLFRSPGASFTNGMDEGTLPSAIGNGPAGAAGDNFYNPSTLNHLAGPSSRLFGSMRFKPASNPVGQGMGADGQPMHLMSVIDAATQLILLSLDLYPPGIFPLLAAQTVIHADYPVVSLYLANPRAGMKVAQTWYFPMSDWPTGKWNLLRYSANPYNQQDGTPGYTVGMIHNQNGQPTMSLPGFYGPNFGFGGAAPTVFPIPWGRTGQSVSNAPAAIVVGAQPDPGVVPQPGSVELTDAQQRGYNGLMWAPLTLMPGYSISPGLTDPYFISTDARTGATQMIPQSPSGNNFLGSGADAPVYVGGNGTDFGYNGSPYPGGDTLSIDPSWNGVNGWGATSSVSGDETGPDTTTSANDNIARQPRITPPWTKEYPSYREWKARLDAAGNKMNIHKPAIFRLTRAR